jgi:hypothetical protein
MKIRFTESELIRVVNTIVEAANLSEYGDEDFVEVFMHHFRPWVKEKHGEDVVKYPLSYLVKKYSKEFAEDKNIPADNIHEWRSTLSILTEIGTEIVKLGLHELPSLRSELKFTEKFKKPLEQLMKKLNLPDFFEVELTEPEPYKVIGRIKIDWNKLITYQGDDLPKSREISHELNENIQDYLGVQIGNPIYGELSIKWGDLIYIGLDDWVKNVFNKTLKKEIKSLAASKSAIHSIRFTPNRHDKFGGLLTIVFKNDSRNRSNTVSLVKNLFEKKGYNTEILRVVW